MEHPETPLRNVPRKNWPSIIQLFAEVVGEESAIRMFTRFNGRHLFFPTRCPPDHEITKTIGQEKAEMLCFRFQNELVTIPRASSITRKLRNNRIIDDWLTGETQADIATKYNLSERQINTIINRRPKEAT